jgi:hypothetical protein
MKMVVGKLAITILILPVTHQAYIPHNGNLRSTRVVANYEWLLHGFN